MYNYPDFKEHDPAVVMEFMRQHPFITLVGCDEQNRPVLTQVPVLIEQRDDQLFLVGHIMRKTDHHLAFEKNDQVVALFTSPHTYVSASWYSNPSIGSTWNYMSVHARGVLKFLGNEGLVDVMKKLTLHFENNNAQSPTVFDNLSEEYTTRMLKGIVAFEIEVQEIQNVFKLSQNRDEKSYHTIMGKLEAQGGAGAFIAEEMKKRTAQLFSQTKG